MTIAEILALIAGLNAPVSDGPFADLAAGGHDKNVPIALAPCPRPIGPTEIEGHTIVCGTVSVPEDHAAPYGKHIELFFTVLKANSSYPEPDPVVYLHGGPGSSIGSVEGMARVFGPFREQRDVVMFDQRAAGLSSASVTCYDALSTNFLEIAGVASGVPQTPGEPEPKLAACIAEIEDSGIDLTNYNTLQNAYDVTSIMGALGYDQFNLYGISYGTKLAMEVMRSSPEGVRSVILDGVAPPWIKLYDTLAVPLDETIASLMTLCAEDEECNQAYPDLGQVFDEVLEKSLTGELKLGGDTIGPEKVLVPFIRRNEGNADSLTPYLPAYFYELHRGKERATYDKLQALEDYRLPAPGEDAVKQAVQALPESQRDLVERLLDSAIIADRALASGKAVVSDLRDTVASVEEGPLADLFDSESSAAALDYIMADRERAGRLVAQYAALQMEEPNKDNLLDFVRGYAEGESLSRLESIISAMSPSEIAATFATVGRDVYRFGGAFVRNFDQRIYACQEDVPYNSPEGEATANAALTRPILAVASQGTFATMMADCTLFAQKDREGFHDVVVSDIPTLTLGSDWDVQTAASWAAEATKGLTNAQSHYIYEAGHGAIVFQKCVADMGVAFYNDPSRTFDDSCSQSTKPKAFYIAPWVEAN